MGRKPFFRNGAAKLLPRGRLGWPVPAVQRARSEHSRR